MSVILNTCRRRFYLDSVALMRMARTLQGLAGVEDAGLMIGTAANKAILTEAQLLAKDGAAAEPGDLIIALRAKDAASADAAMSEAHRLLDQPRAAASGIGTQWRPRTIRAARAVAGAANLALISVPGSFAAAEARKALALDLDVMIFSDNVDIADEIALKHDARARGRIVMGPDCGTALIDGVPLGFANHVPRGGIGIIGASGTGIQEVSCLIANGGGGISHAIGVGGRDLKAEVGAVTTLAAIDLFEADAATRHVVLISKPPAASVARLVLERIGRSRKTFTICFLGADNLEVPANARTAATLADAAMLALGKALHRSRSELPAGRLPHADAAYICGLFSGGTLCTEAQIVLQRFALKAGSNAPVGNAAIAGLADVGTGHTLIDLGADEFTQGRPHPMIDPGPRDAAIVKASATAGVGVILIDIVLGTGGHPDPAGHLARKLAGRSNGPAIVASVTGTEADPQSRSGQIARLQHAGVLVAQSNAEAAEWAARIAGTFR